MWAFNETRSLDTFSLCSNNNPSQKRHTDYSLAAVWFIALPDGNLFDNLLFDGTVTQTHFQSLTLGFLLRWVQGFSWKAQVKCKIMSRLLCFVQGVWKRENWVLRVSCPAWSLWANLWLPISFSPPIPIHQIPAIQNIPFHKKLDQKGQKNPVLKPIATFYTGQVQSKFLVAKKYGGIPTLSCGNS